VVGATGKTGSRVVALLDAAGHAVRQASRSSQTRFVWEDESTWAPALDGQSAAYITYYPDLAFPGAAEVVGRFIDVALACGVRRLVLLSGRGEEGARKAELLLEGSGADWTIVRCAFFNQNFSEGFADAVRRGTLTMPVGDTREPFVDADDIAEVVVAALTDNRHIGRLYELTGPRLLSIHEVAEELSAAIGRSVTYVPVSTEQYWLELTGLGLPVEVARPTAQLIAEVLDGRNASLAHGVEEALGRKPRDFGDYASVAASSGVWDLTPMATEER
jgi:uncharacterized protein YbjT (DUF2867 family)